MPRIVALALLMVLVPALASACNDDSGTDDGTSTPMSSPAAGGTGASGGPAATSARPSGATPRPNASVVRSFTGGTATASVTVASETYDYEGGSCTIGTDDEYVAVNIGDVGGADYFGVLAGRSPATDEDTRSTKGGGEFSGDDVLITFVASGRSFLLRSADTKLTLAPDLRSGTFTSVEANAGADVRGEFSCDS